jgi:tRNA(fMet)-specific endonuclease VapC
MDGKYLLDSNIVIAAFGSDPDVLGKISDADEYFVSSTVLGELIYGALNSSDAAANIERLHTFISTSGVLDCDERTAHLYGEIKAALRRKGKPIPDNDIWIAASAQQHLLTLVSRDSHFDDIDGLERARW